VNEGGRAGLMNEKGRREKEVEEGEMPLWAVCFDASFDGLWSVALTTLT
jgi:hypothetical protein